MPSVNGRGLSAARQAVRALDRLGTRGRTVGTWADLAVSTGLGYQARRARSPWSGVLGERTRNAIYARIWADAAQAAGAEMRDLGSGFLELRRGEAATRVYQQVVALDDPVTLRLALDKTVVHGLLIEAGIPVADHVEIGLDDLDAGIAFLEAHAPCVVKPASGTGGGDGTTTNVCNASELLRARVHATRRGDRVLVERQVEGVVHRLLFLDGELIDVIRNLPPRLTGDGRSTVEELVAAENRRRAQAGGELGLAYLDVGLDALVTLRREGLRLGSVPEAGRTFAVATVSNDNRVEDTETLRDGVADEVVDVARRAASLVRLRLAGVDVIAPRIDAPLEETGGVVAEVNGTPGFHHHYLVADPGRATPVARPILEALL